MSFEKYYSTISSNNEWHAPCEGHDIIIYEQALCETVSHDVYYETDVFYGEF